MNDPDKKTVVVALGGNAILQPGQVGTFEEQLVNVDGAMQRIAELAESGWEVVLTHGNGPQVGNLLIQNALAEKTVAPMPMDVCGAESQGQIGYMLEQTLLNHSPDAGPRYPGGDRAHAGRSRPEGQGVREPVQAGRAVLLRGPGQEDDAASKVTRCGRTRGVVGGESCLRPSPCEIVPRKAIIDMVRDGICVICSGGGGIPVVRGEDGALSGVDAVIDKDLAAAVLAADVGADALLILTDVPKAYVDVQHA